MVHCAVPFARMGRREGKWRREGGKEGRREGGKEGFVVAATATPLHPIYLSRSAAAAAEEEEETKKVAFMRRTYPTSHCTALYIEWGK